MQFNKIIIWGLKNKWHTHRFIHQAFYENAKKLNYKVIWVEDEKANSKFIAVGDLVIYSEVVGKMVPEKNNFEDYNLPIIEGVYYCLHAVKDIFSTKINSKHLLHLEKYQNDFDNLVGNEIWRAAVIYNHNSQTLYQPWGTDLLYSEFKRPVFRNNNFIFWVGSVWNNKFNQGNISAIVDFKKSLLKYNLRFIQLRFIPNILNIFFIRLSRIAPAVVGDWQAEFDYLPCRMFKNISYGHVGFSNVKKFKDILSGACIEGNIDEMLEKVLKLNESEYKNLVFRQQELIKNYTYQKALENIFRAFDIIQNK